MDPILPALLAAAAAAPPPALLEVDRRQPEDLAWSVTLRAFRGGGYVKDHVDLDGLFRVLDFVDAGGELADLFVGKIRVADVPRVKARVQRGELLPARWLPRRLGEIPPEAARLLGVLRGL